jgi:hypothetical protein
VVPAIRANAIIGLSFAIELKSVGLSHAAVQTRSSRPAHVAVTGTRPAAMSSTGPCSLMVHG